MHFQYTPYILPLIAAALISIWVTIYALAHRKQKGAVALGLLALSIAWWTLGYALEIAGADLPTKLIFGKLQYIGIVASPLMWLLFALYHASQTRWLKPTTKLILTIIPLVTVLLTFTTQSHGLVWQQISVFRAGSFSALSVTHGPWFWVHFAYSYALLLSGAIIVLRSIGRSRGLYRGQTVSLLAAVLAPWVGNVVYLTGLSPIPYLDLTPFAFTLTVVALTWGIFGFRLIDVTPLAREAVIEEMLDGMVVLDNQNRIVDINISAQKLSGLTPQETIGRPVGEVFGHWAGLAERYNASGEAQEEVTVGEGSSRRCFELRLFPLHDRQKRVISRVITARDVTARKKAEERIAQLSRAVEASPASIVITDTQGAIQYVNPKFCQVTGYTPAEVLGQNPRILKTDRTLPEVHRQLWDTLKAGQEWRGEFCNRKKNGAAYWEFASISPITDGGGKITHFVAVKEDITERKRVEEAQAFAHQQALEASRLKSQLLAKVSHELRTPLGGILGYAELMRGESFGPLPDAQKEAVSQIIDSAYYLEAMVNELLDQAQIEAGTLSLRKSRFSPAVLLQRLESSMSILSRNRGLTLTTSLDPNLPGELCGDEYRLQEILTNLAGNAIKFTKAGGVQVKLLGVDAEHWAMQVIDTGVGISTEAQAFIFEPFRQVDNAITHQNRGTGLGLSITKQLVDLMGGSIALESEPGVGSTFTVRLPLIDLPEKTR